MRKLYPCSEDEIKQEIQQHGWTNLSLKEKLDLLLHENKQARMVLTIDLGYHHGPELTSQLIEIVKQGEGDADIAAQILGTADATDAVPMLVAKLEDGRQLWATDYVEEALMKLEPDIVIDELRRQLSENTKLSMSRR